MYNNDISVRKLGQVKTTISVMNNQEGSPIVSLYSSLRELFLFTGTIKGHYIRTLYSIG